ncbi:MAG: uroporphyrinogen-III C-methyltransferase [Betaproteobacteria bacterium]|nr:uroporphyrinogen-III C-methyltransferase [Betaproteobacteria bacterium]MDH5352254.1 uroporphyrinogen-III C-methyltransferase [Betaproteobacteria bacterium]
MDSSEQKAPPEPAAAPAAPAAAAAPAPARAAGTAWRVAQVLLLAAALGASGWVWYDARLRSSAAQEDVARRVRDAEDEARAARAAGRAAQETARELQARFAALEARLVDAQGRQAALEALYQELSRNREEWQLAEIEQVLAIAQQQLQISGNVKAALLALQLAEARLARADRPALQAVRRAIAQDIERLKSLPAADLAGMSRRLDVLIGGIDALPLGGEGGRASAAAGAPAPAAESALQRFGAGIWRDLKELVVIRRVDAPEPPLLPAEQAYFLRENLRLRLLSARLALLSRNATVFADDLRQAQAWLLRYYERDAPATREALAQLKALQDAPLPAEPPTLSETLDAVRAFKARRERASG